jgi:hypothetical protein
MKMRPIDAQRWMQPRLGRAWPRRVHHAMVKAGRAGHLVGDTVELIRPYRKPLARRALLRAVQHAQQTGADCANLLQQLIDSNLRTVAAALYAPTTLAEARSLHLAELKGL